MELRTFLVLLVSITISVMVTITFILPSKKNVDQEKHAITMNDISSEEVLFHSHSAGPSLPTVSLSLDARDEIDHDKKVVKLQWTSVAGKGEKDSYHFFSAYFDDRNGAPKRPVVIVMGYAWNNVTKIPLYCLFKYADGHSVCLKEPLEKKRPSHCATANLGAETYHYYCPVKAGEEPPVSVMISEKSTCDPDFTSKEISVGNQERGNEKMQKKFAVCVCGPVVENNNTLQDLVEFISMSKLMGAELITFYISKEQLNENILRYILHRYPNLVRVIEWKTFEKWKPLHYHGQVLIISDCIYRNMYEVEYLAQIDIDEMILPIKGNNWSELLQDIPGKETSASFKFQNAFFSTKGAHSEMVPNCRNSTVAKYFTKTVRYICYPGYHFRTKIISRPRLVLESGIHGACAVISGYTEGMPITDNLAIVCHYREPIPDDCIKKRTRVDKFALKYSDRLNKEMCS